MADGKFYITTPIYYVNDQPHIGHAYTTILADSLARAHRLMGARTFFLTGTDEHGQKVQQAAEKAGITPQEQADRTIVRFQELWRMLQISNDDFIRTTEQRHKSVVRVALQKLFERDGIYKSEYRGWYCVPCERFFTEKDLAGGKCPNPGCGRPVEPIVEPNYFFRMGKYQDWLVDYIQAHPDFIQPDFRRNETLGFLKKKLGDLCISRPKSRLSWGIPLPFDDAYVTYVWFDALVNYISAPGYTTDHDRFARWWPADCHLIGKDILTTHTVYWPIMLKALDLPLPRVVFAHGWWLAGEDKMSKSKGNVVDPKACVDKYGPDAFRYFLMAEMNMGQDASFSEAALVRRYNSDLANDLGNMANRALRLVATRCGGRMPSPTADGPDEIALRVAVVSHVRETAELARALRIDQAVARAMALVREINRYFDRRRPWELGKKGETDRLGSVLYSACDALAAASALLYPVMPGKMAELRAALGLKPVPDTMPDAKGGGIVPGACVTPQAAIFPRMAAG